MNRRKTGRLKYIQLNNEGISLIELVVALLILAIITVPLMSIFGRAAKTNTFNANKADADTVAENIMEAIKVYGLEGTAKEIYAILSPAPGVAAPDKCLGMSYGNVSDETVVQSFVGGKFNSNDSNHYEYKMTGVGEGTHEYDVTITLDSNYLIPADEEDEDPDDMNIVDLYDLSAFNTKSTVFINPLSTGIFYDEETLSQIAEMNETLCEEKYDDDCTEIDEDYEEALAEYNEELLAGGSPVAPPDPVYPSRDDAKYRATPLTTMVNDINRVMNITITKETVIENGASKSVYKIDSSLDYTIEAGKGYIEGNETSSVTLPKSGYCHDVTVDSLKSLYLIYTPFPYMCRSAFDAAYNESLRIEHEATPPQYLDIFRADLLKEVPNFAFTNESVRIDNQTGDDIEVYIVVQGKTSEDGNPGATFGGLKVVDVSEHIKVYSQAEITGVTSTEQKIIKEQRGVHQDKLLNVTITVTNGDATSTITSTIQQ